MQIPLELSFRNIEPRPEIESRIRDKVGRLEKFCDHIIGCRVAIERPHEHASAGNPYRVRIDLTVPPGHEVVVDERPRANALSDELITVIGAAFRTAERQLKELNRIQKAEVKSHEEPRALVVRIFPDKGYGFLKTTDGRDIYFHRNSVVHDHWRRLAVGVQVRFAEEMGDLGPQATTVQIEDKPGERLPEDRPSAVEPPMGWGRSR